MERKRLRLILLVAYGQSCPFNVMDLPEVFLGRLRGTPRLNIARNKGRRKVFFPSSVHKCASYRSDGSCTIGL